MEPNLPKDRAMHEGDNEMNLYNLFFFLTAKIQIGIFKEIPKYLATVL
jgi:hypothetical protein